MHLRRLASFGACLALALALISIRPASADFTFNWSGTPAAPQPWVPGAVSDWDLVTSGDMPSDLGGAMQAQHGADCAAPPATHQIQALSDSVFICNNHLMTALNGGGDAPKSYAATYFAPAQLLDLSQGTARLTWSVSTFRAGSRDWWEVWLSPFSENQVLPLADGLPAFNGPPRDAVRLLVDNLGCQHNQAIGTGTIVRAEEFRNFQQVSRDTTFQCVEDAIPGGASAVTRTPFELDVSQSHAHLFLPGTGAAGILADIPLSFPASAAVVQFSHQSYDPQKGSGGPGTFHWSDVGLSPSIPFTMLRPAGTASVHDGVATSFTLPQPAPAGAFLRFAGLGAISVAFDAGAMQPAVRQAQAGPDSDGFIHEEQSSNYWMPIPAGTTRVAFSGRPNSLVATWWVQDVAVWAPGASSPPSPSPSPTLTATPSPSPSPSPAPITINGLPCTVTFPAGTRSGTCTGTFTPT